MNRLEEAKAEFKKLVDGANTPTSKLERVVKKKLAIEDEKELESCFIVCRGSKKALISGQSSPHLSAVFKADLLAERKANGDKKDPDSFEIIFHDPNDFKPAPAPEPESEEDIRKKIAELEAKLAPKTLKTEVKEEVKAKPKEDKPATKTA